MRRLVLATSILVGTVFLVPAAASMPSPPQCSTHDFRIREAPSQGAGGSFLLALSYRNVTHSACRTRGFPGVTLLGRHHHRLGVGRWTGSKRPRLVVKPGHRIYGVIQYSETPETGSGTCPAVKAVRIIAPDSTQRTTVRLPHGSQYCQGKIFVDPLAGSARRSLNDG